MEIQKVYDSVSESFSFHGIEVVASSPPLVAIYVEPFLC